MHNYSTTNSTQILHSDKDRQVLFAGGSNTRPANPVWRTTAMLEKSLNCDISTMALPVLMKFGMLMHTGPLDPIGRYNVEEAADGHHCSA